MRIVAALALVVTLGLVASAGCRDTGQPEPAAVAPPLQGVRVVIVIPPKDFRRTIYDAVTQALTDAGATFDVCSLEAGKAVGTQGRTIEVTVTPDVSPDQYEAVVFLGGPGMKSLTDDPDLVDLAKAFYEAGKVVGAIRFSAAVLANADLLDGKTVTAGKEIKQTLESKGATVTSRPVEVDGEIVTGHGPEAAEEFAQALVKVLLSRAGR